MIQHLQRLCLQQQGVRFTGPSCLANRFHKAKGEQPLFKEEDGRMLPSYKPQWAELLTAALMWMIQQGLLQQHWHIALMIFPTTVTMLVISLHLMLCCVFKIFQLIYAFAKLRTASSEYSSESDNIFFPQVVSTGGVAMVGQSGSSLIAGHEIASQAIRAKPIMTLP